MSNRNTVTPQNTSAIEPTMSNRNTVTPQNTSAIEPTFSNRGNTTLPNEHMSNRNTVTPQNTSTVNLPTPQPPSSPSISITPPSTTSPPPTYFGLPILLLHFAALLVSPPFVLPYQHPTPLPQTPPSRTTHLSAFLSEFVPVRDTHALVPLTLDFPSEPYTVADALSAISAGDTKLHPDGDDDPLWTTAMSSPDREYWIAGARDELKSLKDLNVFVLVPRSELPCGQRPLKGKLVCKRKCDDTGNITRYKVRYVAKGFAQRYLSRLRQDLCPNRSSRVLQIFTSYRRSLGLGHPTCRHKNCLPPRCASRF